MPALHTTCYFDTFIAVAPDSPAESGVAPPVRDPDQPSAASRTYRMIAEAPYRFTSDDVVFTVWADRRGVPAEERERARVEFFSKGQPCLRASDLGKRYGWGVHSDSAGRVALYAVGTPNYQAFIAGVSPLDGRPVTVKKAMRASR
jgi:hypothetical protein